MFTLISEPADRLKYVLPRVAHSLGLSHYRQIWNCLGLWSSKIHPISLHNIETRCKIEKLKPGHCSCLISRMSKPVCVSAYLSVKAQMIHIHHMP